MTATPSQEWTATTGESAAFRDLILKACFDLGFHGLRVDNPDAVASLASLVANASRLGSVVDNAELSAEVARLRAENERRAHLNGAHAMTIESLRSQLAAKREGETPDGLCEACGKQPHAHQFDCPNHPIAHDNG